MQKKKAREQKPKAMTAGGGGQNMDPAEGDLATIEESIRVHEAKGDLKVQGTEKHTKKGTR